MPTEISKRTITHARSLRKNMTEGELKLWRELRQLKEIGLHVRKQVPIGKYMADFAIMSERIVIEVDGDVHEIPAQKIHDMKRDEWLISQGFKVLRFSTGEIYGTLDGCVEEIIQATGKL